MAIKPQLFVLHIHDGPQLFIIKNGGEHNNSHDCVIELQSRYCFE